MNAKTFMTYAAMLGMLVLPIGMVHADNAGPEYAAPAQAVSGPAIYANICQSCHMEEARGATGAGTIPALAENPHLAGHGYPIIVVLYGHGAMPALGPLLSDAQVAAVLNYVRQNFGNHYTDPILPSEIAASRIPGRQYSSGY